MISNYEEDVVTLCNEDVVMVCKVTHVNVNVDYKYLLLFTNDVDFVDH